jgi:hypothetical protein
MPAMAGSRCPDDFAWVDVRSRLSRTSTNGMAPNAANFKVRGDEKSVYRLLCDEIRVVWDLIMFQRPQTEVAPANFHTGG